MVSGDQQGEPTILSLRGQGHPLTAACGLSRLQAEGLIEIDGRKLMIRNLDAIKGEVSSAE